jgi:MGT family glycosyltransferase
MRWGRWLTNEVFMARAAYFNVPAFGHINPTLPLTAELIRRGEEVAYFAPASFREAVAGSGARFVDYGGTVVNDIRDAPTNPYRLARYLIDATPAVVDHVLPELEKNRPDYLIHDMICVWGPVLAKLLNVPAIATVPTFSFTLASALGSPRTYLELLGLMASGLPDYLRAGLGAHRLWRRYGVVTAPGPRALLNYEGLNVVFTSPEFQPRSRQLAGQFRYVGASIGDRYGDDNEFVDRLGNLPLVYVALGTIFNARLDFYREALKALEGLDVQAIVSVGEHIQLSDLQPIPPNCLVVDRAPQVAILKRAAVFVTHGGMNSVSEGLYNGVPLILVPQMIEQRYVARRVAELGAGLAFPKGFATAAELRGALRRVLEDGQFRAGAAALGEALRACGGARQGAEEILRYTAARGVSRPVDARGPRQAVS